MILSSILNPTKILLQGSTQFSGGESNLSTLTFSHEVKEGKDRILIVTIPESRVRSITSVKFNNISLTQAVYTTYLTSMAAIYYLINPPIGNFNVEVVYNSAMQWTVCGAATFTGVHQTSPLDNTKILMGFVTNKSTTITTNYNNSVIVDALGTPDLVHTLNSGQIIIVDADNRMSTYKTTTTKGNISMGYSASDGTNYVWGLIALRSAHS